MNGCKLDVKKVIGIKKVYLKWFGHIERIRLKLQNTVNINESRGR